MTRRLPRSLEPLRTPIFRWIWLAALGSNVGTWMQNVGAAWLMTSLTTSPLLVALVQTATTMPVFLLGIPAGAIADLMDRRRLLLLTQTWMLAAAAILGALTLMHATGPWTLLALTFALGIGATANGPAWQATIPQLVPRDQLPAAVALNSVQFNIARAIGPAFAGLVLTIWNPGFAFVLNAISFLGVVAVLYFWAGENVTTEPRNESVVSAMWAGIRYVRHAPVMIAVLVRTGAFALAASALWALLPVIAQTAGHGSGGYGILLGSLGVGSVLGASFFSRLRSLAHPETLINGGIAVYAAATLALGTLHGLLPLVGAMFAGGLAWMTVMSTFNVAAQLSLPKWVRARALSVYILVFQGGLAVGSWLWGEIAARFGTELSLLVSGSVVMGTAAITLVYRITIDDHDLTPSMHWPEPAVVTPLDPGDGPVLVQVEYDIAPESAREFLEAMNELGRTRRRDGATRWGVFEDVERPGRFLESFLVESWGEHMRQHGRATVADRELDERILKLLGSPAIRRVTHWIASNGSRS
jgi:MFS family permease